jgi:hypothetical protein
VGKGLARKADVLGGVLPTVAARVLAPSLLAVLLLAGCVSPAADKAAVPSSGLPPVGDLAPLPEVVTKLVPAGRLEFGGGNDLALRDQYAYIASHAEGSRIVDLSDPKSPREVALVPCNGKDLDVTDLPDGRRIMTISSQGDDACPDASPTGGIRLVDVTDAANPKVLRQVPLAYGSHTHTTWGETGLLFNSAYDLFVQTKHRRSEIVDISNPDDPKVVSEFMFPQTSKSPGCHDIMDLPEEKLAVCAAITETMVWDMADPLAPKVIATIEGAWIHHSASYSPERKILVLGDEFAGVLAPVCPNVAGKTPTGALFFYDVTDWKSPRKLGQYSHPMESPARYCSAHNFEVIPGRDLVVGGFYGDGTILVDFSDPANPKMVSQQKQEGTSSWASYYHRGLVVSGDGGRGLDVYTLE